MPYDLSSLPSIVDEDQRGAIAVFQVVLSPRGWYEILSVTVLLVATSVCFSGDQRPRPGLCGFSVCRPRCMDSQHELGKSRSAVAFFTYMVWKSKLPRQTNEQGMLWYEGLIRV